MWSNQETTGSGYGDQGGGYMNSPGNFSSPQGDADRKNRQRAQNILPCTIAQILGAQLDNDKFMLDNIELHQVTIVGMVRSVKESSTRIEYLIDDMTGPPLEVRQFVDNDENTPDEDRVPVMRENMYVRAHGHVRSFQNKHNVVAFKLLPVTDMNELTTHMLEVIHSHLSLTRGAQSAGGGPQAAPQTNYGGASDVNVGGFQGARPDQGLNPIQSQVLNTISSCMDDQGIGINNICQQVRGVPQSAIRDAVEFLSSEGHIYSTIDDEHFKSTDSM